MFEKGKKARDAFRTRRSEATRSEERPSSGGTDLCLQNV